MTVTIMRRNLTKAQEVIANCILGWVKSHQEQIILSTQCRKKSSTDTHAFLVEAGIEEEFQQLKHMCSTHMFSSNKGTRRTFIFNIKTKGKSNHISLGYAMFIKWLDSKGVLDQFVKCEAPKHAQLDGNIGLRVSFSV